MDNRDDQRQQAAAEAQDSNDLHWRGARFQTELDDIARRRRRHAMPVDGLDAEAGGDERALVGLACSGGGIRSATFNLGIVQALHKRGLLAGIDYISTVSGGGFLGSCLANQASQWAAGIVVDPEDGGEAAVPVRLLPATTAADLAEADRLRPQPGAGEVPVVVEIDQKAAAGRRFELMEQMPAGSDDAPRTLPVVAHGGFDPVPDKPNQLQVPAGVVRGDRLVVWVAGRSPLTDAFPMLHRQGQREWRALRHLRRFSNYLTPDRFLASLRLPGLFIAGLVANAVMLLPWVLLATVFGYLLWGPEVERALAVDRYDLVLEDQDVQGSLAHVEDLHRMVPTSAVEPERQTGWALHLMDVPTAVSLNIGTTVDVCFGDVQVAPYQGNPGEWLVYTAAGSKPRGCDDTRLEVVRTGDGSVELLPVLFDVRGTQQGFRMRVHAWEHSWGPDAMADRSTGTSWRRALFNSLCASLRYGCSVVTNDEQPTDQLAALRASSALVIGGTAALVALLMVAYAIGLSLAAALGWQNWSRRDRVTRWGVALSLLLFLLVLVAELQPLAMHWIASLRQTTHPDSLLGGRIDLAAALTTLVTALSGLGALGSSKSKLVGKLKVWLLVVLLPLSIWLVGMYLATWHLQAYDSVLGAVRGCAHGTEFQPAWFNGLACSPWPLVGTPGSLLLFTVGALVVFTITHVLFDVNATSLHAFYRDRLSRAYHFDPFHEPPGGHGELRHSDTVGLGDLDPYNSPYLLVNTTLNVPRSKDPTGKARRSENFIFSRRWCGSRLTRYVPTERLVQAEQDFGLASAVAISGAAVAPNMGRIPSSGLGLVMALLNARLGYWVVNPANLATTPLDATLKRLLFGRVGPWYLLREALGRLSERSRFVNISDGGHLENMGIHELVRRGCRVVVCGDGEADGEYTFGGLADAIRMVQIDLGIKIAFDIAGLGLDGVTPGPDGRVARPYAVATIHYGDGKGYLVYLKSSLPQQLGAHEQAYQRTHADYPHESTGDQFFDEAQFEAYRSLGYRVAAAALHDTTDLNGTDGANPRCVRDLIPGAAAEPPATGGPA